MTRVLTRGRVCVLPTTRAFGARWSRHARRSARSDLEWWEARRGGRERGPARAGARWGKRRRGEGGALAKSRQAKSLSTTLEPLRRSSSALPLRLPLHPLLDRRDRHRHVHALPHHARERILQLLESLGQRAQVEARGIELAVHLAPPQRAVC